MVLFGVFTDIFCLYFYSDDKLCAVCLNVLQEGETVLALSCAHAYHRTCISTWLIMVTAIMGAYHSTQNFEIFEMGTNGTEISWEKFQKIRKLLNFRKANHSTENSRNESQMERKFPGKMFRYFGYTSRGCPLFRNLCKFPIFHSALACSFGRDHSRLNISRKDDGDAHSIKNTFYLYVNKSSYS